MPKVNADKKITSLNLLSCRLSSTTTLYSLITKSELESSVYVC